MTCYRCGEGFTWASATLIKAKPRKPTTTLRLAALAAATWVSDSVPALRGLAFAVGEDGRLTVESGDAKAPPSGPDLTPLTLEAARALPQGTRVVLLQEYNWLSPHVAAGAVGVITDTVEQRLVSERITVDFPGRSGAGPLPSTLALASSAVGALPQGLAVVPPAGCTVTETAAKQDGRWTVARSDGWCVDDSSTAELIVWRKEGNPHDRHTWKKVRLDPNMCISPQRVRIK